MWGDSMTIADILSVTDFENDISICHVTGIILTELEVITPNTPITEYEHILNKYADKPVRRVRVDMPNTLTIIY